ncbi:MAG: hypothetical protein M3439_11620 [Chloroflexota bacterium]|nr:hypothetical protein [Chloroflexota bacterium]
MDIEAIARRFDMAMHGVAGVRELWATQSDNALELWLLIDSINPDDERRLFQIGVDMMVENLHRDINLHVLNPRFFTPETDLRAMIPANADLLPLR